MTNTNQKIYYPTFQKRIAANAIDMTISGIVILFSLIIPVSVRGIIVILYLYTYFFLVPTIMRGQSLGKKVLKIKTVKLHGYKDLSILDVHKREFYKYFLVFISLFFQLKITLFSLEINLQQFPIFKVLANLFAFAAVIFIIGTIYSFMERRDKRGLHDLIAKTINIDLDTEQVPVKDEYEESLSIRIKK